MTRANEVQAYYDEKENILVFQNNTYRVVEMEEASVFKIALTILVIIFLSFFLIILSCISLSFLSSDDLVIELRSISGTEEEKKCTEKIMPILSNRYWLICTIFFLETLCVIYIPLYLTTLLCKKTATVISLVLIVIFGRIFPQTLVNISNQFIYAEKFLDLTYSLMYITSPISFPLSKVLDKLKGEKHKYRLFNSDIKALIEMHKINHLKELADAESINEKLGLSRKHSHNNSYNNNSNNGSADGSFELNTNIQDRNQSRGIGLNDEEANLMISALEIREKKVIEIMIPIKSAFMIDYDERLDKLKIKQILDKGYSRIPVYANNNPQDVLGLVRIKQLISVDINDDKSLRELGIRLKAPLVIHPSLSLIDLLREFRKGKSHMAFITEQVENLQKKFGLNRTNSISNNLSLFGKYREVKIMGIVTLEDVIEHMFNLEIYDEDDYEKMKHTSVGGKKYVCQLEKIEEDSKVLEDSIQKRKSEKEEFLFNSDSYSESLSKRMGEQFIV